MMLLSTPMLVAGLLLTAGARRRNWVLPLTNQPTETKLGTPPKSPDPDIAAWISIRIPSDLHFSPDEKRLAFTVDSPRKGTTWPRQVWVLDVATRVARPFTRSPKSEHWPRWSRDGRVLALAEEGFRTRGLALSTVGKVESWPELGVPYEAQDVYLRSSPMSHQERANADPDTSPAQRTPSTRSVRLSSSIGV